MIPSSFSIDYLARKEEVNDYVIRRDSNGSSGTYRDSPSPTSSVCSGGDNTESIAQMLLSLDKSIKGQYDADCKDKPPHSYIALISMAILSSAERRMLLRDIYQFVMDKFAYYSNKDKAWRSSIRHNLSLNECFIKNGRLDNGNGNYWSIHPACVNDFARGDFRRRQARRRAWKSMMEVDATNTRILNGSLKNLGFVPMTYAPGGCHPYPSSPNQVFPGPTVSHFQATNVPSYNSFYTAPPSMPVDFGHTVNVQQVQFQQPFGGW